jgi:hypothetical protein
VLALQRDISWQIPAGSGTQRHYIPRSSCFTIPPLAEFTNTCTNSYKYFFVSIPSVHAVMEYIPPNASSFWRRRNWTSPLFPWSMRSKPQHNRTEPIVHWLAQILLAVV